MSKKPKKTTALARRRVTALARRPRAAQAEVLPVASSGPLTEQTIVGTLGKIELKLTAKEEAVLNEPVNVADVRVKPTGQVYVSHPTYTRWFNRAFGRLGWALVPAAAPMKSESGVVVVPYLLHVHGKPAAFAFGEQDYFEGSNREQTYGDALEATVASGLRRCAKRMGVGLELWDRPWGAAYLAEHCIQVQVAGKGLQWRRREDPPLYKEVTTDGPREPERRRAIDADVVDAPAAKAAPRDAHHAGELQPITKAQLERFWVVLRNSGRIDNVVRTWLKAKYGIDSSSEIARRDYDAICEAIESPGSLPL